MASNDKTSGGLTARINQRFLYADWVRRKQAAQLGLRTPLLVQTGSGATKQSSVLNNFAEGAQFTTAAEQAQYLGNVTPVITVPSAPRNVVAVAGNTRATITFDAPISDGGSAITYYIITATPGNILLEVSENPINFLDLDNVQNIHSQLLQ